MNGDPLTWPPMKYEPIMNHKYEPPKYEPLAFGAPIAAYYGWEPRSQDTVSLFVKVTLPLLLKPVPAKKPRKPRKQK